MRPDYFSVEPKSVFDLLTQPIQHPDYIIEPRILPRSGKLLFGGEAKIGKTFLGLNLARALALGIPPFGIPHFAVPNVKRVLLLEQEVGEEGLRTRLERIFIEDNYDILKTHFHYLSKVPGFLLNDKHSVDYLTEKIRGLGIEVLILDPLGRMMDVDENSAQEVGAVFRKLDDLMNRCHDLGTSVILSHHFSKPPRVRDDSTEFDALSPYNYRGTGDFFGWPDCLTTCARVGLAGLTTSWDLRMRWTLRHGETLDDMRVRFNEDGDLRIKWRAPGQITNPLRRRTTE